MRDSSRLGCSNKTVFIKMSIEEQICRAVEASVPDSEVEVIGNGGHFSLKVIAAVFEGKTSLEKQRMVYSALTELMSGMNAPVHAIDNLETLVPEN